MSDGHVMQCSICGSETHSRADCPRVKVRDELALRSTMLSRDAVAHLLRAAIRALGARATLAQRFFFERWPALPPAMQYERRVAGLGQWVLR